MRTSSALAITVAAACASALTFRTIDARACGGCFHIQGGTQNVSDITDERMLLSVSPTQSTLYDQIRYQGNPEKFAWVLPIRGTVTVGLSADVVFDSMDALTATRITGPFVDCPSCGGGGVGCGGSSSALSAAGTGGSYEPPVTVTKQENVGPYETVQLHAANGSGAALNQWLTDNGFAIPSDVQTTIDAYASDGFDFLAMKLLPNQGVQAMRPVRVTSEGGGLSLPLRMAAVGTGPTVGITLWVVASGRYEPQNFPFFHIEDSDLIWDFKTSSSNYATLRASEEAALAGRGWEIESSITLNEQLVTQAIESGGTSVNGGSSYAPASEDYAPIDGVPPSFDPDSGIETDAGTPGMDADQVRAEDERTLLEPGNGSSVVRVTRMRTDIAHTAMSVDLVLRASADQSELSNVRFVTKSTNAPACPKCDDGGCDTGNVRPESRAGFVVTIFAALGLFFTRVLRVRKKK